MLDLKIDLLIQKNDVNVIMILNENSDLAASLSLCLSLSDLSMGSPAAPQVAPPCWGAPMVNVVCVL